MFEVTSESVMAAIFAGIAFFLYGPKIRKY